MEDKVRIRRGLLSIFNDDTILSLTSQVDDLLEERKRLETEVSSYQVGVEQLQERIAQLEVQVSAGDEIAEIQKKLENISIQQGVALRNARKESNKLTGKLKDGERAISLLSESNIGAEDKAYALEREVAKLGHKLEQYQALERLLGDQFTPILDAAATSDSPPSFIRNLAESMNVRGGNLEQGYINLVYRTFPNLFRKGDISADCETTDLMFILGESLEELGFTKEAESVYTDIAYHPKTDFNDKVRATTNSIRLILKDAEKEDVSRGERLCSFADGLDFERARKFRIGSYRVAVNIDPSNIRAKKLLIDELLGKQVEEGIDLGEVDEVLDTYRDAISEKPELIDDLLARSQLFEGNGDKTSRRLYQVTACLAGEYSLTSEKAQEHFSRFLDQLKQDDPSLSKNYDCFLAPALEIFLEQNTKDLEAKLLLGIDYLREYEWKKDDTFLMKSSNKVSEALSESADGSIETKALTLGKNGDISFSELISGAQALREQGEHQKALHLYKLIAQEVGDNYHPEHFTPTNNSEAKKLSQKFCAEAENKPVELATISSRTVLYQKAAFFDSGNNQAVDALEAIYKDQGIIDETTKERISGMYEQAERENKTSRKRRILREIIDIRPDQAKAQVLIGDSYQTEERFSDAINAYISAKDMTSEEVVNGRIDEAKVKLVADCHKRADGEEVPGKQRSWLKRGLRYDPGNDQLLDKLTASYQQEGRGKSVRPFIEKALKVTGNQKYAKKLNQLN